MSRYGHFKKYPKAENIHLFKCNLCGYTNTYVGIKARNCPVLGCDGTMRRVD